MLPSCTSWETTFFHSGLHVAELAHAGGLDEDAVGGIVADDLLQRLSKVAHQAAADAAGVHLGDLDSGLLEEAAVDADFTKLILNEHNFLACIGFLDHLLDESGLASTQETGVNVNFRHRECTFISKYLPVVYH